MFEAAPASNPVTDPDYTHRFSEPAFWLFRAAARKLGFVRSALALFYCFRDPATPAWVKALIVGALGYFVFPFDAVPDALPIVGWLDDAGVLMAAFATIRAHVKPAHEAAASAWLGQSTLGS